MKKILFLAIILLSSFRGITQNKLSDFLHSAVENSPLFIDNLNQGYALTLDSILLREGLKPQVNLSSNNLFAPVINGYGYDEIITNMGNYNALLGVNYTIIGKNNLKNKYSSFNIQRQELDLNAKLNERDLKQAVTSQFITVYGEQQILNSGRTVLEVLKKEDILLKNITEKGIYRQTDYLAFLMTYKQQQLAFSEQLLQIKNDLYLLNYLCGIIDTTYLNLEDPGLSVSPSIATEQTVTFKRFMIDSLKLQNNAEQIKFNYKPKINLFGDVGYNTTFIYQAEKNFGASIGLNLSIPIYDGNQRKTKMDKLSLSENTRITYAGYYKKQYSMKQIQIVLQISETEKLVRESEDQLTLSETLLKANNKLLESGDIRISDYAFSLVNYISLNSGIQQLITNKMQLINQFNYLNY